MRRKMLIQKRLNSLRPRVGGRVLLGLREQRARIEGFATSLCNPRAQVIRGLRSVIGCIKRNDSMGLPQGATER